MELILYRHITIHNCTSVVKAQDKDKQDFIKEIDMMKRITPGNIHIVNMIGCVTISEPMCLLCELVKHGSLLPYLRSHHKKVRLCSMAACFYRI